MQKISFTPLDPEKIIQSRKKHGTNQLSTHKKQSFWRKFLGNLADPVIRILLIALILNLIFSIHGGTDWLETLGIGMAVFLATLISTLSEHGSEKAFARLKETSTQNTCRVYRLDEQNIPVTSEIPTEDVVVGDLIFLEAGESIPADGILVSGQLVVDQSAMTGESRDVKKYPHTGELPSHPDPNDTGCLFRGCTILSGQGQMFVQTVGDHTFLGHISQEVQTDTRESPLKIRLSQLAKQISSLGYIAAVLVAVIYLINAVIFENSFDLPIILSKIQDFGYVFETLFSALTLALTVLVVAVPEGLPMMIAVVLSANIKRMVKDHVLVRKPVGIEAAGSMNILFTDKTGTLTQGKLSVGQIILGDGESFKDMASFKRKAPVVCQYFVSSVCSNTSAMTGHAHGSQKGERCAIGGNATDRALLDHVLSSDRQAHLPSSHILAFLPFDSRRKFSCAWVSEQGKTHFYIKGAPEKLLPMVTHTYNRHGEICPASKQEIQQKIHDLTSAGERVLLIAKNTTSRIPTSADISSQQTGELTLLCLVVLKDRLRAEAPKAVATLHKAGIHVVMMTGDNQDTAVAIAQASGILSRKVPPTLPYVVDSTHLSQMTDEEVKNILPHLCVVGRALPDDKSRLVRLAQEMDLVVGMTGDGINDAPALKRADVGFAMGDGTQVAKDAGDIIILDNNLASIAHAVLYGRTIFKSIRKFITLQLTMNLCAMGVTMICPFLGVDAPVTVVQMLWINLIMDTLGGLAFAGEAPLASYMEEPPKKRDEPILNKYMTNQICILGGLTIALCLFFLKSPWVVEQFRQSSDDIYLLTAFFVLFIFSSIFNCFNARTDRLRLLSGLAKNKAFCLIMTAVLCIQVIFVYVGGDVLRTAPLTLRELFLTCILAFLVFPAEMLRKIFWRLGGHSEGF